MAIADMNFDPGRVLFGGPSSKPYLGIGKGLGGDAAPGNGTISASTLPSMQYRDPTPSPLGPEAVRATGTGPFDPAYRQNLATFAGGQFQRPGGNLMFNPTDPGLFGGAPSGAGNAPVTGAPISLLSGAMGGQPFQFPQPTAPTQPTQQQTGDGVGADNWQFWLRRMRNQGGTFPLMQ